LHAAVGGGLGVGGGGKGGGGEGGGAGGGDGVVPGGGEGGGSGEGGGEGGGGEGGGGTVCPHPTHCLLNVDSCKNVFTHNPLLDNLIISPTVNPPVAHPITDVHCADAAHFTASVL